MTPISDDVRLLGRAVLEVVHDAIIDVKPDGMIVMRFESGVTIEQLEEIARLGKSWKGEDA